MAIVHEATGAVLVREPAAGASAGGGQQADQGSSQVIGHDPVGAGVPGQPEPGRVADPDSGSDAVSGLGRLAGRLADVAVKEG